MVSSPVIALPPAKYDHCTQEPPTDIFAERSLQNDVPCDDVTKHSYHDQSWSQYPTKSNRQSSEEYLHGTAPNSTQSLPNGLPPVSQHLSFYATCAGPKFKPYQPGRPTALEHRFMTKNLLKRDEADISLIDVRKGEDIFKRGLRSMPNISVHSAIVAKRAEAESKRLRALATVWELESAEKHAILLQTILRDCAQQYLKSKDEVSFFEKVLVKRTLDELEDDADFSLAAYSHDIAGAQIANLQLDYMEEVGFERKLSLEGIDLEDAGYHRLEACMDNILAEARNFNTVTAA
ncbi:hypothetical protein C8R48DRAFT_767032 [Suillus tomentosus]|nr:hypothetical protein C8R48DRAFT_767032 [Suillus tomentosus]